MLKLFRKTICCKNTSTNQAQVHSLRPKVCFRHPDALGEPHTPFSLVADELMKCTRQRSHETTIKKKLSDYPNLLPICIQLLRKPSIWVPRCHSPPTLAKRELIWRTDLTALPRTMHLFPMHLQKKMSWNFTVIIWSLLRKLFTIWVAEYLVTTTQLVGSKLRKHCDIPTLFSSYGLSKTGLTKNSLERKTKTPEVVFVKFKKRYNYSLGCCTFSKCFCFSELRL